MSSVILLLTGPMQSWGERSVFKHRGTLTHPTRSGIIGLIASALGQARTDDLAWTDDLTVTVRVDRAGIPLRDFHTVGGGLPVKKTVRVAKGDFRDPGEGTLVSERFYLADAAFTVAVDHPDDAVIDRIAAALARPHWPPFLGRKACIPAYPVLLGTTPQDGPTALAALPAYRTAPRPNGNKENGDGPTVDVTIWAEGAPDPNSVTILNDHPVSFHPDRRTYRARSVTNYTVTVPAAGTGPTAYRTLRAAVTT